ncbi:MAG TPA: type II secretion system F family protein [Planctomycetota bacterium]|nr:type II secretion system F family protein [Planctomycetota bacterium]
MSSYTYEAMDAHGKEVKSEIDAASEADALEKIRALQLFPTKVNLKAGKGGGGGGFHTPVSATQKKKGGGFSLSWRVKPKELTAFTRQFATLLDAGLPVVRSLDILHNQLKPGKLKMAIGEVKEDVEGGSSLSEGLQKHPTVFDKLYVNMIRAGEAGGVLDEILERLADYREKAQRLQQKIIGALVYPAAVVFIASCILSFIMIFIIPKFEEMFKEMDIGELPTSTKILLMISGAMLHYWYILIFTPVLFWLIYKLIVRTPRGRLIMDAVWLKVPIFGGIISKSAVSRFCRTLGTLVTSGVPILEALSIIKLATGNAVVANAVETVHNSIKEGDTIAEPLKHSGVFDDLVVNMIQVGEETGELDKMLMKVADTYDNEVDTLVSALMSLLEPVLIVAMGLTVGFIVIALFMPLIKIMDKLSGGGGSGK